MNRSEIFEKNGFGEAKYGNSIQKFYRDAHGKMQLMGRAIERNGNNKIYELAHSIREKVEYFYVEDITRLTEYIEFGSRMQSSDDFLLMPYQLLMKARAGTNESS